MSEISIEEKVIEIQSDPKSKNVEYKTTKKGKKIAMYRTFAITISPGEDNFRPKEIHALFRNLLLNWVHGKGGHAWYVFEKGTRHVINHCHAGFLAGGFITANMLHEKIKELYYDRYELPAKCIKNFKKYIWYKTDWVTKYMTKEGAENFYDGEIMAFEDMDFSEPEALYPPKGDTSAVLKWRGDSWYVKQEEKYNAFWGIENSSDTCYERVDKYLRHAMYKKRTMAIVADPRIYHQKCAALTRYIMRDVRVPTPKRLKAKSTSKELEEELRQFYLKKYEVNDAYHARLQYQKVELAKKMDEVRNPKRKREEVDED